MRTRIWAAFGAAILLACVSASSAWAHAFLSTASPKVGSSVSASPHQIVLSFTEALEPAFSKVQVSGPGGRAAPVGSARISGKQIVVPVSAPLAPGVYHVVWRVTASDTHKTQGDFTFTVKP